MANTSQTEMDESDNSALNHSSLSEGTMQFEDASNAISAMPDAAEASATGLLSTPEREKANAVADEALRIADSKRVHGTEAMGERHVDTTTSEQPIQVEQKGARRGHQESLAQNKPAQGVDPDCRGNFDIEESLGRTARPLFKDDGDHGANAEVSMISTCQWNLHLPPLQPLPTTWSYRGAGTETRAWFRIVGLGVIYYEQGE